MNRSTLHLHYSSGEEITELSLDMLRQKSLKWPLVGADA